MHTVDQPTEDQDRHALTGRVAANQRRIARGAIERHALAEGAELLAEGPDAIPEVVDLLTDAAARMARLAD